MDPFGRLGPRRPGTALRKWPTPSSADGSRKELRQNSGLFSGLEDLLKEAGHLLPRKPVRIGVIGDPLHSQLVGVRYGETMGRAGVGDEFIIHFSLIQGR